jgi:hypothetical protein
MKRLTLLVFIVLDSISLCTYSQNKDSVQWSKDSASGIHIILHGSPNSGKIIVNINPQQNNKAVTRDTSNRIKDTIAPNNTFYVGGEIYNNINSVRDNDPPGFSQYVVDMSLPLKKRGIIIDSTNQDFSHWVAFRNLFFEFIYSPLAYKYDTIVTSIKGERLVNRLDLLQYSTVYTQMYFNIATLFAVDDGLKSKNPPKELFEVYFDLMAGFLDTKENIYKDSTMSLAIPSALYGIHIDMRTQKSVSENVTFDLGLEFFQINPFTSSVEPYLNPQFRNISDTGLIGNKSVKSFQRIPNPLYFNLDAEISSSYFSKLISIGTKSDSKSSSGSKSASSVEVYLNADVFSNFNKRQIYDNTYFQIQLGTALNFN